MLKKFSSLHIFEGSVKLGQTDENGSDLARTLISTRARLIGVAAFRVGKSRNFTSWDDQGIYRHQTLQNAPHFGGFIAVIIFIRALPEELT
jgi:hypothetical protein